MSEEQALIIIEQANRIAKLESCLRWCVYLGHDIGKSGGKPAPGEFEAAMEQGKKLLEGKIIDNLRYES